MHGEQAYVYQQYTVIIACIQMVAKTSLRGTLAVFLCLREDVAELVCGIA